MVTADVLKLIDDSEFGQIQKNVMKGFIQRADDMYEEMSQFKKVVEEHEKRSFRPVTYTEDFIIYEIINSKEEWDVKYPFRLLFRNKTGNWEKIHTVCDTVDNAMLAYLGRKYTGLNSQFSEFAMKMLGIEIPKG